MRKQLLRYSTMAVLIFIIAVPVIAGDWYERTEIRTVPLDNISKIDFNNIDFTEFEYQGDEHATALSISITYKVHAREREDAEDALDWFNLDIDNSKNTLSVTFEHPKQQDSNIFSMLFRRSWKKWKAEMKVTGPINTDIDLDGDFSTMTLRDTTGDMVVRADFSEVLTWDHTGLLDANVEFGSLTANRLNGGFSVNCEFGDVELTVNELKDNSSLKVEFGSGDVHLPADAGVSFVSQQSFGDVDYHLAKPVLLRGKGNNVTYNDGGVNVELSVEFGDINITDRGSVEMSLRE